MVEPVPADEAAENAPVQPEGRAGASAGPAEEAELSRAVVALTGEDVPAEDRRRMLGRLVRIELGERGVRDLFRPQKAIAWITDTVTRVAPHIPVRDLDTLRAHHPGLDRDALAERLIRNASRVTAGIGAAGGGLAAVEWVATPSLLSAPVLLAAETVAVVAVEMKLIGELHAVYGHPIPGNGTQRAFTLIQSWAERRGVNPLRVGGSVAAAMGTALRKELRDRLLRRFGRNLSTLGPLLTGAAVGGFLNRRATLSLGHEIRKDLAAPPDQRVIEA
ncbi:hypothetical protein ABT297_06250 [Dactylosporangium sp. NPDC000555]|uniref:hypothetical protein n=1 Tax=Dactylosporangium sp. NPDC000555 TaxID=3154260 RepID=UPI00332000D5